MKRLLTLIIMAGLWTSQNALSQSPVVTECGTYLPEHNPHAQDLSEALRQLRVSAAQQPGMQSTVTIIPVVVHIIHDYSPGTNISRAKVLDGMRMLNDDYNYRNPDTVYVVPPFKQLVANVQVEFRLATLDPNGNCTDGITRTYSTLTHAAGNNVKSLIMWDPARYLNIWVAGNLANGSGAFATLPCGPSWNDGIVCRADRLGFTYSHTISHEAGHYFGLDHTWGPGPVGLASNCSQDDGVADTPNTIGSSVPVCNTSQVYCGNLVNIQNIMDYGGCLIMFTHGQKAVMQNALQLPCRASLWSPANLQATGTADGLVAAVCAPVADFTAGTTPVCEGNSVQYTDFSHNAFPDSSWTWSWSFPGGIPSTSTSQNPTVTYHNSGTYSATLVVSSSNGSDTLTRTAITKVKPTTGGEVAPFTENFEDPAFPVSSQGISHNWEIINQASTGWHRTATAAFQSTASMRVNNLAIAAGNRSSLISSTIDMSNMQSVQLEFDLAYALRNTSNVDKFYVYTSTNCGLSWQLRYINTGIALSTNNGVSQSNFIPASPSQWRHELINLSGVAGQGNVLVKLEVESGAGNNLFVDNVQISGTVLGIPEALNNHPVTLYPNPVMNETMLGFYLPKAATISCRIQDVLGRELAVKPGYALKAGNQQLPVGEQVNKLPAGIYLLQLVEEEKTITLRFTKN